ncbi:MAG: alpha/beta hydrolase [Acidimicrobiales bacterium]
MSRTITWTPDVLDGFEQTTLTMPAAPDGPVDLVVVRRAEPTGPTSPSTAAVLYVHGFGDYFFQTHLADEYERHGVRFYAVDLRRHGRSLRPHQRPDTTDDIAEYVADLDAAVQLLVHDEGVEWLLVNGHSTGGLAAVIHAHRGAMRRHVDAVFLNSPFLDMNLPGWQELLVEPLLSAAGRVLPNVTLPGLSPVYGQSIHADHHGAWTFDLRWKPIEGFPARLGWIRAIHRAQAEIVRGLDIRVPVLLLHAARSAWPREWSDDALTADVVLDIDDMIRLAPRLGRSVECHAVPDGIHDLVLSGPAPRARTFELLFDWLDRVRG